MDTATSLLLSALAAVSLVCAAVGGLALGGVRRRVAGIHGSYPRWVPKVAGFAAAVGFVAYLLVPGFGSGIGYAGVCATVVGAGWLLCGHAYVVTATAVRAITRHPWLEADGEGLRGRLGRVRHVYPDWRYLINAHYGNPSFPLALGGFLLTTGGFITFAFERAEVLFLAGTFFLFGLVSLFILSPTLKGYQTYSGSVFEIGEKAHNPEFIDALVEDAEMEDTEVEEAVVPPTDLDAPLVHGPELEGTGARGASVSGYPPESDEREGGWATSVFGLFRGYLRVAAFMRAYLPPRAGTSLTIGIPCLVLCAVFFVGTGVLISVVERLGLGISEQTVAAYAAVWLFVAFWVFVPAIYFLSRSERKGDE